MTLAELRRAVALVTQRPILFSVPLRENLIAARPDAPWEEVLAACEAAGVAAFVDDLPDGYDTLIGERGVNLSGGQRQRVALARALLAGARVLVLDDPMSAVDTQTERLLVANLRPAVAGTTVLVATQRLSTVEVADRAVVLDDGRVVEYGAAARAARPRRRRSPRSSGTRCSLPRKQRTGLSRLLPLHARQGPAIALLAVVSASRPPRPVAGWLLVGRAIDARRQRRARPADRSSSPTSPSTLPAGRSAPCLARARRARPEHRARPPARPVRPPHGALAALLLRSSGPGWIIARLTSDVDALSDVLSPGPRDARLERADARRRDRRALPPRLAARARRARRAAAGARWSRAGSSGARTRPSPTCGRGSRR